jgi:hypothetical protein
MLITDLNLEHTVHDNESVDSIELNVLNLQTKPDTKNFGAILAKRFVFFGGLARILTLMLARY